MEPRSRACWHLSKRRRVKHYERCGGAPPHAGTSSSPQSNATPFWAVVIAGGRPSRANRKGRSGTLVAASASPPHSLGIAESLFPQQAAGSRSPFGVDLQA